MLTARATVLDVACGARVCSQRRSGVAARRKFAAGCLRHDTLARCWGEASLSARVRGGAAARPHDSACFSLSIANYGRRGRLIREKIIGRSLHGFGASIAVHRRLIGHRVLALAHQPARQQRRRILFQPGIQQLGDLLTEIGGVVQAREFVALQGIARSGEQELPGWLGLVIQGDLREKRSDTTSSSTINNSTKYVRSVEKCAKFWLASPARGAIRTGPPARP